eukprot:scaffold12294_cov53-Phaeocystis_antarctica.AAC.4
MARLEVQVLHVAHVVDKVVPVVALRPGAELIIMLHLLTMLHPLTMPRPLTMPQPFIVLHPLSFHHPVYTMHATVHPLTCAQKCSSHSTGCDRCTCQLRAGLSHPAPSPPPLPPPPAPSRVLASAPSPSQSPPSPSPSPSSPPSPPLSSAAAAVAAATVAGVTPNMKESSASASTPHSRRAVSLEAQGGATWAEPRRASGVRGAAQAQPQAQRPKRRPRQRVWGIAKTAHSTSRASSLSAASHSSMPAWLVLLISGRASIQSCNVYLAGGGGARGHAGWVPAPGRSKGDG